MMTIAQIFRDDYGRKTNWTTIYKLINLWRNQILCTFDFKDSLLFEKWSSNDTRAFKDNLVFEKWCSNDTRAKMNSTYL